ncbi:hypothetical protein FRC07_000591 [Ceratobasidium sp. 392]|nr:hypothetical protein FRC07_000591 [Ceratobasidium sp. 392]
MPLDHIGIGGIKDFDASRVFYEQALAPLGYKILMTFPNVVGFGTGVCSPDFWIAGCDARPSDTPAQVPATGVHVAFKGTRTQVHAFYEAALQAGGKCNGPPGLRPNYHPFYYAAFVLDPSENNIEVVNHGSGWQWFWFIVGTKLGFVTPLENCPNKKQD